MPLSDSSKTQTAIQIYDKGKKAFKAVSSSKTAAQVWNELRFPNKNEKLFEAFQFIFTGLSLSETLQKSTVDVLSQMKPNTDVMQRLKIFDWLTDDRMREAVNTSLAIEKLIENKFQPKTGRKHSFFKGLFIYMLYHLFLLQDCRPKEAKSFVEEVLIKQNSKISIKTIESHLKPNRIKEDCVAKILKPLVK